jgi:nickel-dependent lactate racemase
MGISLNPLHDLSSVLHTGEKIIGDGAKDCKDAMNDAAKVVTHMSPSEIRHTVLNVAGMVPVIGAPADAVNAGWYAAQGDWGNAALSAAAAIPGVNDLVGGARLGATALKVECLIKDGTEIAKTTEGTIADNGERNQRRRPDRSLGRRWLQYS